MQKLNKNNYYLVRNIYVIDSNVGMGGSLDHVFLVMVNAVGRRSEIGCCRKKGDVKTNWSRHLPMRNFILDIINLPRLSSRGHLRVCVRSVLCRDMKLHIRQNRTL